MSRTDKTCWPLPELARRLLEEFKEPVHKDDAVEGVLEQIARSIDFDRRHGRQTRADLTAVERGDVERWIERLLESGFIEEASETGAGNYRLTPRGYVALVLDRHDRWVARRAERRGWRPFPPSDLPARIGPAFEDLRIDQIDLSNRTSYRLAEAGISTVGDLVRMSPKEVLEIRGIARKSLEEIEWELRNMGLELGVEADRR